MMDEKHVSFDVARALNIAMQEFRKNAKSLTPEDEVTGVLIFVQLFLGGVLYHTIGTENPKEALSIAEKIAKQLKENLINDYCNPFRRDALTKGKF